MIDSEGTRLSIELTEDKSLRAIASVDCPSRKPDTNTRSINSIRNHRSTAATDARQKSDIVEWSGSTVSFTLVETPRDHHA